MTKKRVDVYCPVCGHRGKARMPGGATYTADEIGKCTRCGHERVPGSGPSTGRPVGRPRLTPADALRRHADALHEIADELDSKTKK